MRAVVTITLLMLCIVPGQSASLILNARRLHLRSSGAPEWEQFAAWAPDARRLDLRFNAQPNASEATLFIRQDDVRQDWFVEVNGRRLGKLFLMDAPLVHTIAIPPGALVAGENVLSILPPDPGDDIVLDEIRIDSRSRREALHEATLAVRLLDIAGNRPLPCRVTIVDQRGALASLVALTNAPPNAVRPGVVYTGNGEARVGLPAGEYTVYASRGFEWSMATQQVNVAVGQSAQLTLPLKHEVPASGFVSCDTHVHSLTHSGHGDATLDERVLTLAGEDLQLPVATDHNFHTDYSEPARRMSVADWFTPVVGNEVTTPAGHFNIFPVEPGARIPDFRITDWPTLMKMLRATPGVRVVVLNHPRNIHNGFQPFAGTNYNAVTGENKRGSEFGFDAIELMNSSAQQSDYLLVYRDWFGLLNYGYRVTGVGSSDSHDVSRYIVGQGRTYIPCNGEDPARINVASACSNLLAGRALVSMGLLTQMTVDGKFGVGDLATGLGPDVRVRVTVSGPSWVTATNVALFANGIPIQQTPISDAIDPKAADRHRGEKATITWSIPRPGHDVHLVAIATGPAVLAPFWAIPRPYQPTSPRWEGRVIGSTNPIWLDADGDGQFSPARTYARRLVTRHGSDPRKVVLALGEFDESVAAQAASLCAAAGRLPTEPEFGRLLKSAAPHVGRGFAAFVEAAKPR